MPLSDVQIRSAKPTGKTQKLSDGGGLQLWVEPSGSKLWRLAFRFEGKQKKLALGVYPILGLKDARSKAADAKKLLSEGIDPSRQRKIEKLTRATNQQNTFAAVAAELLERKKKEGKASATIGKREWLYAMANTDLGDRPISEISSAEVLAVLRKVEAKGILETARRLRTAIGEVFRFGISTARAANDPTAALRGALMAPKVKHHAAIVEPIAFGGLLRAIWTYEGQPEVKAALQLIAYLHTRPGDLRMAKWSDFDLDNATFTIEAAGTKMRREFKTPIARQVVEILKALKPISGHSLLVFPGLITNTRPISENTLNAALRRIGYSKFEHTSHGFRSSFKTMAGESNKWSLEAVERHMDHLEKNAVIRAYARGEYWEERKQLCQWWADYCDTLRLGAHVVQLNSGKAG